MGELTDRVDLLIGLSGYYGRIRKMLLKVI